ncbi:hypothetical protein YC2023_091609 [Brassica napus]
MSLAIADVYTVRKFHRESMKKHSKPAVVIGEGDEKMVGGELQEVMKPPVKQSGSRRFGRTKHRPDYLLDWTRYRRDTEILYLRGDLSGLLVTKENAITHVNQDMALSNRLTYDYPLLISSHIPMITPLMGKVPRRGIAHLMQSMAHLTAYGYVCKVVGHIIFTQGSSVCYLSRSSTLPNSSHIQPKSV